MVRKKRRRRSAEPDQVFAPALRRRALLQRWLLLSLLLAACDRADTSSERATQCAKFCEALEKCDDATDMLDCREHCAADEVRSDRYFRARADCGEKLSCNLWVEEVDSQGDDSCVDGCDLVDCVDDTLAASKLSATEQAVCSALSTKLNACDPSLEASATAAECESILPVLSGAYRDESELCSKLACEKIESCLEKLADQHGTDLKVFSGTLTPR